MLLIHESNFKNKIVQLLFICYIALSLTGCTPKLENISINGISELPIDASDTLTIIKNPVDAKIDSVEWKSSNESIVKVRDGVIIGVSEGKATIIVTVNDKIKATKDITIYHPTESISIDKTELKLSLNDKQKINVTIKPENSLYTLKSENSFVATISSDGIVEAINYGKTRIIAKSRDNKEAICDISVSVIVPNFNSMSLSDAKKWGIDNNIVITTDTDYSETVKKDKVISQSIPYGTEINEPGKSINIIYSIGHKPTLGEMNALRSAKSYIDLMSFSAKGLKKQLKYEGYSDSEAQYGVDNCGANWNEQAAKSAKSYIELMSFSRNGLKKQLLYEGFTESQAEYGVKAAGY